MLWYTLERMISDHYIPSYPAPLIDYSLSSFTAIVRDDLLGGGTKVRALEYLIGHDPDTRHVEEWVYGSCPAHGYMQISLPEVCRQYGKQSVLFMAKRDPARYHPLQHRGLTYPNQTYQWVDNGMLSVTQKRARDYVAESPQTRRLIPMGGRTDEAIELLRRVMVNLPLAIMPDVIWSVASSGTLTTALQRAFPQATVYAVQVGHTMTQAESGRAVVLKSPYAFAKPVWPQDTPPYPSVPEYDAKVWPFFREWRQNNPQTPALIWNVGA